MTSQYMCSKGLYDPGLGAPTASLVQWKKCDVTRTLLSNLKHPATNATRQCL